VRLSVVRAVAPYLNGISANPPPRGRELSSLLVGLVRNRRKNHRVVNRHVRGGSHRGGIVDRAGCPRNPPHRRQSRLRGIFCGTGCGSGLDHGRDHTGPGCGIGWACNSVIWRMRGNSWSNVSQLECCCCPAEVYPGQGWRIGVRNNLKRWETCAVKFNHKMLSPSRRQERPRSCCAVVSRRLPRMLLNFLIGIA